MTDQNAITLIGAGAVGGAVARRLKRSGVPVAGIFSANGRSASALARNLGVRTSGRLTPESAVSRRVLIAVPDGAIAGVADGLEKTRSSWRSCIVLHTSGALNAEELNALKKVGAAVGSFHPLQTFPKRRAGDPFDGIWCAVEGDAEAVRFGRRLAAKLGARSFPLSKKEKTLYHIAAVFASNYQVTLYSVVEQLAGTIGIKRRDVWRIFRPLAERTAQNVFSSSPAEALTGPIARGDYRTIMGHLDVLEKQRTLKHFIPLYSALGVETATLAKRQRHARR